MGAVVEHPRALLVCALAVPVVFSAVGMTDFELNDLAGWSVRNSYSARAYDAYTVAAAEVEAANTNNTGAAERTVQADSSLDLYWVSERTEYDFLNFPQDLYYIRDLEQSILALSEIQEICLLNATTGSCQEVYSATTYLPENIEDYDRDVFAQALLNHVDTASFFVSKDFDIDANSTDSLVLPMLRSRVRCGLPLAGYSSVEDHESDQEDTITSTIEDVVIETVLPERKNNNNLTMYFDFTDITSFFAFRTLATDSAYAGAAIAVVVVMLCFHTRSVFLGVSGLLQILLSFPTSFFVYRFIFTINHFGTLQVLAIFLVLGIGTDDIFIFWDAFQQSAVIFAKNLASDLSETEQKELMVNRMVWSFKKAAGAMLVTSLTTFVAFLVTAITQIINIRVFGVFAGVLIFINFLMVVSIFPCLIVVHDRFVKPYKPCLCLCWCWPFAASDRDKTNSATVATSSAPKLGRVSRFFRNYYIPTIVRIRWIIIPIGIALAGSFAYCASRFTPGTKRIEDIFDDSNPVTIVNNLKSEDFIFSSGAYYTAPIVFGIELIDRSGTSPFDPLDYGTLSYSTGFDPLEANAQEALLALCDEYSGLSSTPRPDFIRESTSGEASVECWIQTFDSWLEAQNKSFPVNDSTDARNFLEEWYDTDDDASDYSSAMYGVASSGVVPNPIKFMMIDVVLSAPTSAALDTKLSAFRSLASDLTSRFSNGPESIGTALVVSDDFVVLTMQETLVRTAITGLAAGVGFGFVCLLVMTRNILISLLATCNILLVAALVLGTMQLSIGSIGFMEAISITALVGLSFDFTLHYAIAYMEYEPEQAELIAEVSPDNAREGDFITLENGTVIASRLLRTRIAYTRISVSVLSGAITTAVAAAALTLCEIQYLGLFGKFLLEVVLFSLATSNTFLPALLACFGPQILPSKSSPEDGAISASSLENKL